jgi:hypothetical protein
LLLKRSSLRHEQSTTTPAFFSGWVPSTGRLLETRVEKKSRGGCGASGSCVWFRVRNVGLAVEVIVMVGWSSFELLFPLKTAVLRRGLGAFST